MSNAGPSELRDTAAQARRLSAAMEAIQARLAALDPAAGLDGMAEDLAEAIQALDAAAKEAIR